MGMKMSKLYSSYKSQVQVFKLVTRYHETVRHMIFKLGRHQCLKPIEFSNDTN